MLSASAVRPDPRLEVAARLLLPTKGVASSRIEVIDVSAELVADVDPSVRGRAAWVADNLRYGGGQGDETVVSVPRNEYRPSNPIEGFWRAK